MFLMGSLAGLSLVSLITARCAVNIDLSSGSQDAAGIQNNRLTDLAQLSDDELKDLSNTMRGSNDPESLGMRFNIIKEKLRRMNDSIPEYHPDLLA